jgi:hypothetical protein
MRNDLRLASTIKLYNPPPPVKKPNCNPRLASSKEIMSELCKSLKSGYLYTR